MKSKSIICLLLAVFMFQNISFAQFAIDINGGWYQPSMDYWNEETAVNVWDDQFKGSLISELNISFELVPSLDLRLGVGYWTEEVSQSNIPFNETMKATESLKLELMPLSASLLYNFDIRKKDLTPYIGVGAAINFVQLNFQRTAQDLSQEVDYRKIGRDYIYTFIGGIRKNLGAPYTKQRFSIGLEGRYAIGHYTQQLETVSEEIINEDVSLNGLQLLLSLRYKVN